MAQGTNDQIAQMTEILVASQKVLKDNQNEPRQSIAKVTCLWTFWEQIDNLSKKLSHECTKFCLSYMNPPIPEPHELEGLLKGIKMVSKELESTVLLLPHSFGQQLIHRVTSSACSVLSAVQTLVAYAAMPQGAAVLRAKTGIAWDGCKALKDCPRNNTACVLDYVRLQDGIIIDAFTEISEALNGDGSNWNHIRVGDELYPIDDSVPIAWTPADKANVRVATNLLKAIKLMYRRFTEALQSSPSKLFGVGVKPTTQRQHPLQQWQALDKFWQDIEQCPEMVDDFVLSMYPPINYQNLQKNGSALVELSLSSVTRLQQSCVGAEDTAQHLSFVNTALNHNARELSSKLPNE